MRSALAHLGVTRSTRAWLEAEIKRLEAPHLDAAKKATAHLRPALKEAEAHEAMANSDARALFLLAEDQRRRELLAGHEAPAIDLPEGWIVQRRPSIEISDPDLVPRSLCTPDKRAVTEALKAGQSVRGATLTQIPVFVRRETK